VADEAHQRPEVCLLFRTCLSEHIPEQLCDVDGGVKALVDLGGMGQPVGLQATGAAMAKKGIGDLTRNLVFDLIPGVLSRNNGRNEGFDFAGFSARAPLVTG